MRQLYRSFLLKSQPGVRINGIEGGAPRDLKRYSVECCACGIPQIEVKFVAVEVWCCIATDDQHGTNGRTDDSVAWRLGVYCGPFGLKSGEPRLNRRDIVLELL